MSEFEKERREEQERVNHVVDEIEQQERALLVKTSGLKESVIELRRDFWEDVTVNIDDPDDIIETEASIKQQAELLSERERTHGSLSEELKTLQLLKDSPYFGRIDFKEESEEETDEIYIGIASLMDQAEENFLVHDWRAPISSLYYDHAPGKAKYETAEGTIKGDMTLKRQYIIRRGELKGMFDTGVTIVDSLLQQALGNNASTTMKSIVATIQKEQNKIIRNEGSRRLIVQGVAGSGKTSAAMQRIAYLMYRYRGELNPEQIIMFSPNPLFSSYVSNVLPELGESNVKQLTFLDFLQERVGERLKIESPFKQMEYVLTKESADDYSARMKNIHYKSSLPFKEVIDDYVSHLKSEGIQFRNITFRKRVLISKEEIAQYFYSFEDTMSIPNRMEFVLKWLLKQIEKQEVIEKDKDWVMQQVELMDREDYQTAYFESQEIDELEGDQEEEILRERVVERVFSSIKKRLKSYAFINVLTTYRNLFKAWQPKQVPSDWEEISHFTENILSERRLLWEEATPFAYLQDQLFGATENRPVRYLLIDEAQDYSMFQFAYIQFLFPYTRMTLLGDINQAIYSYASQENPLLGENLEGTQDKITLTKSYRSTKEIVEFTSYFAPGYEKIEPFNRKGPKPQLLDLKGADLTGQIVEQVQTLTEAGHESIAIICKTMEEAMVTYKKLKEKMSVRLIDEETYTFQKGVLIVPVYLAKGIEFDAVILPDVSNKAYGKDTDQTLFYTACTRAMHDLVMLVEGEESRFIQMVPEEKYETS